MDLRDELIRLAKAGNEALARRCEVGEDKAKWIDLGGQIAQLAAVYSIAVGNDGKIDEPELHRMNETIAEMLIVWIPQIDLGWLQSWMLGKAVDAAVKKLGTL